MPRKRQATPFADPFADRPMDRANAQHLKNIYSDLLRGVDALDRLQWVPTDATMRRKITECRGAVLYVLDRLPAWRPTVEEIAATSAKVGQGAAAAAHAGQDKNAFLLQCMQQDVERLADTMRSHKLLPPEGENNGPAR